jgi:hypothetical protein
MNKIKDIAAATRRYLSAGYVLGKMRTVKRPPRKYGLEVPRKSLRLLALDGGGTPDLSLSILKELMKTISPDGSLKPCDYFDMIGGTGSGG